jgi:hypothetical protein
MTVQMFATKCWECRYEFKESEMVRYELLVKLSLFKFQIQTNFCRINSKIYIKISIKN